jgi:hypothetical protein
VVILSIIALSDYFFSGVIRRTIVFYSLDNGLESVEERFVARTGSAEGDIRAFTEEIILGPAEWETAPLVDRTTSLNSLFLRSGTVFISLSGEAALPQQDFTKGGLLENLRSMERDIKRNFMSVRNVRFFIGGQDVSRQGS